MQCWSMQFKWKIEDPEIFKLVETLITGHKENLLSKDGFALQVSAETFLKTLQQTQAYCHFQVASSLPERPYTKLWWKPR